MYDLTLEQIESILIDTGVVYADYGEATERTLAPTRGGSSFVVEREVKIIERDGSRGKEKGLRRIITENAMLTVRLLNMSQENLALALPGANFNAGVITNGNGSIPDEDYLKNITLVGETLSGKIKIITLYNALHDGNLTINAPVKDEAVMELQISAHYNPADLSEPIYKIEEAEAPGTHSVTFNVDDGVSAVENAQIIFFGGSQLTSAAGAAVFTNVAEGLNRPFEIRKGGFETYFGSVDVATDKTVNVSLTAIE